MTTVPPRYIPCTEIGNFLDGDLVSKLLRGLAAGYGAKKLGGGCFSTVLIFIVLWFILGYFGIFS